ncbi:hypothetical protein K8I61_04195 [bacterium]|nr:hypothetical protein [bacterium]
MNRMLGVLALGFLLGATTLTVLGASGDSWSPAGDVWWDEDGEIRYSFPEMEGVDAEACIAFRNRVEGFGQGFNNCYNAALTYFVSNCSLYPDNPDGCVPLIFKTDFDQWWNDCLDSVGGSPDPEIVPPWQYDNPRCVMTADLAATAFREALKDFCDARGGWWGGWGIWELMEELFCLNMGYFKVIRSYPCGYYECVRDWPGDSGDDDDDDDDDTDFQAEASIHAKPAGKLEPSTKYEFDFVVANTSKTAATHWIHQVEIYMPTPEYHIHPIYVSEPDGLHGIGEWERSYIGGDEPYGIRWDFVQDVTQQSIGDIREGESLDFSFRGTSDANATDGFDYRLVADSGLFVADTAYVMNEGDAVPGGTFAVGGEDDDDATPDDDDGDIEPGDDDGDADDSDDDGDPQPGDDDNDDAKADDDDDDDDGGGLFSC